jgi:hypothetical protein
MRNKKPHLFAMNGVLGALKHFFLLDVKAGGNDPNRQFYIYQYFYIEIEFFVSRKKCKKL